VIGVWKEEPLATIYQPANGQGNSLASSQQPSVIPHHQASGLLNPAAGEAKFRLTRHAPSPELACFVARYWVVRWDLRGQPAYVQERIPHPCVNLVIEPGKSAIYGVETGRSTQTLAGKGQVFGVKFRPGAFYPFFKRPVAELNDRSLPLAALFGVESAAFATAMVGLLEEADEAALVALAEAFLRPRLPAWDETVAEINRIVDAIVADRTVVKVDDLVERFAMSKRTLQRLFQQVVGVSPKWVIQRYRLHEAAEQLAAGSVASWAQLAVQLGYFDQAHFVKDFKSFVGVTPAAYARGLG
jgi:AraC-like DNA-binding protein